MSWSAAITTCEAGLRLRFARPVRVLELTPEKARELAAVLLVVAEESTAASNEAKAEQTTP